MYQKVRLFVRPLCLVITTIDTLHGSATVP
jgi:hypothetical protein